MKLVINSNVAPFFLLSTEKYTAGICGACYLVQFVFNILKTNQRKTYITMEIS